MFNNYKPLNKLTKQDWILLRLLFYITSTDASSATVKDVVKTMDYVRLYYGTDTVLGAFNLIRKELAAQGEYDNPESLAMRMLKKNTQDAVRKAVIE